MRPACVSDIILPSTADSAVANSTRARRPAKPRPDLPLFKHQSGRRCKKVWGKH